MEKAIVSNAFCTGVKPVYQLNTQLGRSIKATGNHKFLTIHGWKRLDELTLGDRIAIPRQIPSFELSTMEDDELALLGHLIGDGCTLPQHSIQYTTGKLDLAELVAGFASKVFGDLISPRIKKERNWYQVYLTSTKNLTHGVKNPITKWLESFGIFGLRSYEKFVPKQVFAQPQRAIALFLRHLWATDGCIFTSQKSSYPAVHYASSSEKLSRDVQSLLLRIGIIATLKVTPQGAKGRNQYRVVLGGKPDLEKFINIVGAVGNCKQAGLQSVHLYISNSAKANTNRDLVPKEAWSIHIDTVREKLGLTNRQMQKELGTKYCGTSLYKRAIGRDRLYKISQVLNSEVIGNLATSDIYWEPIVRIDESGEELVYDLTVPTLENFVANNLYVHNSIEQDADLVIMLYRDEYYNPDTPDRGLAEIIITKHRNGPTGITQLLFDSQYTRFRNLAKR
jgi:replicative DNA helicase